MGFLSSPAVRRRAVMGAVALAASCAVFEAILPDDPARRFDHRVHVEDEGLECSMCHLGAEDDDRPGMPVLAQCRLCHEEPGPGEADPTAGLFDPEGQFAHALFGALSDEVVFSHLAHVEAGVGCAECHGDVTLDARIDGSVGVSMAECIACHDAHPVANECATCHLEISREWAPPSHAFGWTHAHGPASCEGDPAAAAQCSLCHEQSSCTSCHLENPPVSHTNYWRRRGHGMVAVIDRDSCSTCHKRDSCQECHSQARPANHVGQWGGTRSNHCAGCHLPASTEEGCYLCHLGTPSHALATPLPPGHHPGMNCRQCHGAGVPLPHVDNGDACTACHK